MYCEEYKGHLIEVESHFEENAGVMFYEVVVCECSSAPYIEDIIFVYSFVGEQCAAFVKAREFIDARIDGMSFYEPEDAKEYADLVLFRKRGKL